MLRVPVEPNANSYYDSIAKALNIHSTLEGQQAGFTAQIVRNTVVQTLENFLLVNTQADFF